jgi:hypothetical protein
MKKNIDQLLEQYWNAEASLQEEAELRSYFSSDDVAPDHEQFKDLFTFFSISRLQSTDLDVEEILSNLSDIDLLLEKYWDAETSLDEEAQLKEYFSGDTIDPEHTQYKDLFTFYQVNKSQTTDIELKPDFNANDEIEVLLEKYWNAETSLDEERNLRTYFTGNEVAVKHEDFRGLFSMISEAANLTTDLDVSAIINSAEGAKGSRAIGSSEMPRAARTKVFSLQKWATGLAAVFVMGFAAVTVMNQNTQTQYKGHATILDEEAEAREAYEITKEALSFLSKNMNTGSRTVVESVSKAEKVSIFK